ncbi:flagellar hook-length control protein FliK [Pacificibacter sp. AS14]|uniref:flagellar hook-length control protein FliK n=1 Tax=Pacificibacter sp. AS14 TaxID=3135785 RepID=UPI00316D17E5
MQFSNLLQLNSAVAGAQADSVLTAQSDEIVAAPTVSGFHAVMEEGDNASTETEIAVPDLHVLGHPVFSFVVPAAVESISQVGVLVSSQEFQIGGEAIKSVSDNVVDANISIEEGLLAEASAVDVETVQLPDVISEPKPVTVVIDTSKFDVFLTEPARPLTLEPSVLRGVSHVDKSVALSASLGAEAILMQTAMQTSESQAFTDGGADFSVKGGPNETHLLAAAPARNRPDIDTSLGKLIAPDVFTVQKSESLTSPQTDNLNQDGVATLPSQKSLVQVELTGSSPLSAPSEHRDVSVFDVMLGDVHLAEADNTSSHHKVPQSQVQSPVPEAAAVLPFNEPFLKEPDAMIEADSVAARVKKQDEIATASPTPLTSTQTAASQPTSFASKSEVFGASQRAVDAPIVEHGEAETTSSDGAAAESPTGTAFQSPSASFAIERHAAFYSGLTENAAIQAVADGGSQLQDIEIKSFYGGTDGVLSQLDQLSQTDPLTQTSRVELPARLAAQIADVARQLPDGPIEISLSPEELGKVKLTFQVSENGAMNVVVAAERAETLELMRRNVDSLLAEFSDLGYEGSSFQFQQDDQGASGDQSDQSEPKDSNGTFGSADRVQASHSDTNRSSPVRLHLDGTSGMDLRL